MRKWFVSLLFTSLFLISFLKLRFRLTRPIFESIYQLRLSQFAPKTSFPNSFDCVWHIRVGDISLGTSASLIRTIEEILSALPPGRSLVHHIVSAKRLCPGPHCAFVQYVEQHAPLRSFEYYSSEPDEDMKRMIYAKVLIGTGSSFAFAAAQVASSKQIFASYTAKEVNGTKSLSLYDRGDTLLILDDGSFADKETLRQRMINLLPL